MKGKEKQMPWGAPVLFRWTQTHPTPFGERTTKYCLPLFPIRVTCSCSLSLPGECSGLTGHWNGLIYTLSLRQMNRSNRASRVSNVLLLVLGKHQIKSVSATYFLWRKSPDVASVKLTKRLLSTWVQSSQRKPLEKKNRFRYTVHSTRFLQVRLFILSSLSARNTKPVTIYSWHLPSLTRHLDFSTVLITELGKWTCHTPTC